MYFACALPLNSHTSCTHRLLKLINETKLNRVNLFWFPRITTTGCCWGSSRCGDLAAPYQGSIALEAMERFNYETRWFLSDNAENIWINPQFISAWYYLWYMRSGQSRCSAQCPTAQGEDFERVISSFIGLVRVLLVQVQVLPSMAYRCRPGQLIFRAVVSCRTTRFRSVTVSCLIGGYQVLIIFSVNGTCVQLVRVEQFI